MAERALELMIKRSLNRTAFGKLLAEKVHTKLHSDIINAYTVHPQLRTLHCSTVVCSQQSRSFIPTMYAALGLGWMTVGFLLMAEYLMHVYSVTMYAWLYF